MSYLLDKKIQRKKVFSVLSSVFVLLILFYFRLGIWNGLSYVAQKVFHPVLTTGNNATGKFGELTAYFSSKTSLYKQNQDLQSKLNENNAAMANYDSVLAENADLKAMLGRKNEKVPMTLAAILSKPNQSFYDTLVIDAGTKQGLREGNVVFAYGNVPIGRIAVTYDNSSKVILFSNSGERTQVVISGKNAFMEIVGRGGGNFEMVLPRDLVVNKGDQVVLPGITPYVVGIIQTIISDPRDPFSKALLSSPINIQELKFVEVES